MKRFKCKVIREDEYIIEIDEDILNKDFLENFKRYFYNIDTYEEHAEHIAQFRARFGAGFIEGYGYTKVNDRLPLSANGEESGININIISEDYYIEVETEEMEE